MIRFLVIEGNIGAGKTSLSNKMAVDLKAKLLLERFEENPFLPMFYKDQSRYAFPVEMSFLADRYNQLNSDLGQLDIFSELLIADYYFNKSLIFAQNTLNKDEMMLYRQFFDITYNRLPKPNLYVYIHSSVDKLLSQIKKRGRSYEKGIDGAYLKKIENGYFTFFKQQKDFPVLVIDVENLDFINNDDDYMKLKEAIFTKKCNVGYNSVIF